MRLLLVEDDPKLGPQLQKDLQNRGYAVDLTASGEEAEFMGAEVPYGIIILDLGLPDRSGIEVLKAWRRENMTVPVLILTARDSWQEKVEGFQAGADDYLAKPFHFEELVERLGALIRRASGLASRTLEAEGFVLDQDNQAVVLADGSSHVLTGTEYRLLHYLMLNPGKILSKTTLTEHVYEFDADKDSNVIEVYIRRLRRILPDGLIRTLRGQGYIFGGGGR
ncbi:response regulator transcription factor [Emcibacter nanhaiensis]|uniref:Response regulator transcription factor n=1 Tax=Emcibacter nanhaiensis TaxID=1505037 RepID=A0A501PLU9_9PROT|nr:response regulator transcription factor [Emcibacter nanhaiensis]TPD60746.1 response regulator transcription factor [Emcibacter nanhaiensis]